MLAGRNITINLHGDYASLFSDHKVEISAIFNNDDFLVSKTATRPCYLKLEIRKYLDDENTLTGKIVSYNEGRGEFTSTQIQNSQFLEKIQNIRFEGGTDTMKMFGIGLKDVPEKRRKLRYDHVELPKQNESIKEDPIIEKPVHPEFKFDKIILKFTFPLKKITFDEECVFFENQVTELDNSTIDFVIENEFIQPVHDSIKPYFSNILNLKLVHVEAEINYKQQIRPYSRSKQVQEVKTHSHEIDKITPDLIEKVKLKVLKSHIRKAKASEQSLLTREAFLELSDNKNEIKELYKDDETLLKALTEVTKTKHHDHLMFLSKIHESNVMRLRFIPKPISFMFLIKGEQNYYFVWETADTSEATYLWSITIQDLKIEKGNLKRKLDEIDCLIAEMLGDGKKQYIKKKEENFMRIYHNYTDDSKGFISWKEELQDALN